MVYVVERYLPGLTRESIAPMQERLLEAARQLCEEGVRVRYLGSTIVEEDEACFCRFEAATADAVADVNRWAKAPYDRIVHGVHVPAGARGGKP